MKKLFEKMKEESGQALVIVAVGLVALLGITAFSVDLGMAYNAKAELQAAADAAALAGAQDLPNMTLAKGTAENYAGLNEVGIADVVVSFPDAANLYPKKIEVRCSKTFEYLFAKVLGFDSKVIVARAVATREAPWLKDALPFINLDDAVSTTEPIVLWEKVDPKSPGDFERLWDNNNPDPEYVITGTEGNYRSTLTDLGDYLIAIKSGISNDEPKIASICQNLINSGGKVYVLSLTAQAMAEYQALIATKDFAFGNKTQISTDGIVLLECTLTSFDLSNANTRGISLNYTGVSYPLNQAIDHPDTIPDLSGVGTPHVKLIE